jgi:hypothetical protein
MTRQIVLRPIAMVVAAAVFVAACGGSGPTTAPATGAPATPAAATVAPATQAPVDSGGAFPSFALPSFVGDQELEDMMPTSIGGVTLTVLSMTGTEFLGSPATEDFDQLLTQLGKTPADMSVAFAGAGTISIVAFRIKGVPASQIYDSFLQIAQQSGEGTITDATFSGKSVKKMVPADVEEGTSYVYAVNDVVFVVGGDGVTDAQLTEAFSQLP